MGYRRFERGCVVDPGEHCGGLSTVIRWAVGVEYALRVRGVIDFGSGGEVGCVGVAEGRDDLDHCYFL